MVDVIGIDEVGRGAWAGPLVVGAVKLSRDIPDVKDSKLIKTHIQRMELAKIILSEAEYAELGWVTHGEIDNFGLSAGINLAIRRALRNFKGSCKIIIDGNINYLADKNNSVAVIKADLFHRPVSAASIIAKVARDNYMIDQAENFPGYNFDTNVGYGTKKHRLALKKLGVCTFHRTSYLPVWERLNG